MNDQAEAPQGATGNFGGCCNELKEALAAEDFEPLITVGPDGILYLSVGLVELEGEEPGIVDHPVFFCPFCGTELQSKDRVKSTQQETAGSA
jgi:hypothetical protein